MKDEKTVVILNCKLVWKEDCIEYEADEQHAQKVWSGCGLGSTSKGLDTPSIRGLVARANCLAQDRPDIQFVTKDVCRCMSKEDILEHPRVITQFKNGGHLDVIKVYTESTSGGIVVL